MNWQEIETAPKTGYCIGADPHLKRPFVMKWNARNEKFKVLDGFGDETPTHWMPAPEGANWQSLESAPKDQYCLGYDPVLKRPFVMLWNFCEGAFVASPGDIDDTPTLWAPLPAMPTFKAELIARFASNLQSAAAVL